MQISEKNVNQIQTAVNVCRILGIEGVMISEGQIRGTKSSLDAAIISPLDIGLDENIKIGIGRVDELVKRLGVFEKSNIELKLNDRNECSVLTIGTGRSKMQYRCTASSMLRFPKSNDDIPMAEIVLTADEVKHLVKAVNTMGSEYVVFQLTRKGEVNVEATDPSTNDVFSFVLETPGEVLGDENSFVFNYLSALTMKALSAAQTGDEPVKLVIGQTGSMTTTIHNHTVFIMAQLGDDEYDEED